jgi:hypothetical protein
VESVGVVGGRPRGVVGGRLSFFGEFSGVENMQASTVGRGARGVETAGEITVGLGGLRGEEVMTESAEDWRTMLLGDSRGLDGRFMLVATCQQS